MTVSRHKSIRAPWFVSQFEGDGSYSDPSLRLATYVKDSIPYPASQSQNPPAPSSPSGRISPAVLFIIVILAVVFFISGLLHLVVRLLIKKQSTAAQADGQNSARISGSDALQRQLQQLFHLHDSGLDQAFIDALPLFLYPEIVGSKESFDCAVCLCEFVKEDKLRLLPLCGHAFHVDCIDTWLLSNSTCPLCRGALFVQDLTAENPFFDFEDLREEERLRAETGLEDDAAPGEKRVFPVRLGKFKKLDIIHGTEEGNNNASGAVMREEGESSSSSLGARRCFSMGSYQYVVVNTNLQVALSSVSTRNGAEKSSRWREVNGHSTNGEAMEGKRLGPASRRESFSMSKVWQWSNMKGKLPISSDTSLYGGLQI